MAALELIALFLGSAEPYADGFAPWLCEQVHPHPGGSIWIARQQDDQGRAVAESVYWNAPEPGPHSFQAHWRFPNPAARRPGAAALSGSIPLSAAPAGPVRVRLVVDGKPDHSSQPGSAELRTYEGRIFLSFRYGRRNGFPDIHGRKRLDFRAVEEGGRELGSLGVPLPRWKLVDRQVERARRDLAVAGRKGAAPCQRLQEPPSHPPGY
jgi:hypothetical protein